MAKKAKTAGGWFPWPWGFSWLDYPTISALFAFRIVNSLIIRTWFVPDEYFQSVEVAYKLVYNVGHLSWEWNPKYALRSYIHPLIISPGFYALKLCNADSNTLIRLFPHIVHSLLFSIGDFYFHRLLCRIYAGRGKTVIRICFLLYLTNWFIVYCAPRTLSNSLELIISLIALDWYPLTTLDFRTRRHYSAGAALVCLIRPTAAVIWIPLALYHLWQIKNPIWTFFRYLLPPSLIVAAISISLDSVMYGHLTFPAWNFVRFNVLSSGSAHFGSHPSYWYLTEGIPPLLTSATIPLVAAIYYYSTGALKPKPSNSVFFFVSLLYILVHSFIAHKEHRFLLPIIPLLIIYIGSAMCQLKSNILLWMTVLIQIPLVFYLGMLHQKAPNEVVSYLTERLETTPERTSIAYLMPCYSLPESAALHPFNVNLRTLDCSPPFAASRSPRLPSDCTEESDCFNMDPLRFVRLHWEELEEVRFIVAYEKKFARLQSFLKTNGFFVIRRFYNTRYPTSDNQDQWIVIAERK